jgi:uncharacterized protein
MPALKAQLAGVFVDEGPAAPALAPLPHNVAAFIGQAQRVPAVDGLPGWGQPRLVSSWAEFEREFGGLQPLPAVDIALQPLPQGRWAAQVVSSLRPQRYLAAALRLYFAEGAPPCWVCATGPLDAPLDSATLLQGAAAIATQTHANLWNLPDAMALPVAELPALHAGLLALAATQANAFVLLDLPPLDADAMASPHPVAASLPGWHAQFHSGDRRQRRFGAAFTPWLRPSWRWPASLDSTVQLLLPGQAGRSLAEWVQAAGPRGRIVQAARRALREARLELPPAALVLATLQRSDAAGGLWKAPSDQPLLGVHSLLMAIGDNDQELLRLGPTTGLGFNPLRNLPQRGLRLWGARTLASDDNEYRYFTVQRLVRWVQACCAAALQAAVFEPQGLALWQRTRAAVENFLFLLWRQGALQGDRTDRAFFVRCGLGETMTQADLDQGRLVLQVGLAALRPSEFIVFEVASAVGQVQA